MENANQIKINFIQININKEEILNFVTQQEEIEEKY